MCHNGSAELRGAINAERAQWAPMAALCAGVDGGGGGGGKEPMDGARGLPVLLCARIV